MNCNTERSFFVTFGGLLNAGLFCWILLDFAGVWFVLLDFVETCWVTLRLLFCGLL